MKSKIDLDTCHCCGGKATFKYGSILYSFSVCVYCTKCNLQSAIMIFGDNGTLNEKDFTRDGEEAACEKAAKLWNKRIDKSTKENTLHDYSIPMKPIFHHQDRETTFLLCPKCYRYQGVNTHIPKCLLCGQAIDWSKDE